MVAACWVGGTRWVNSWISTPGAASNAASRRTDVNRRRSRSASWAQSPMSATISRSRCGSWQSSAAIACRLTVDNWCTTTSWSSREIAARSSARSRADSSAARPVR